MQKLTAEIEELLMRFDSLVDSIKECSSLDEEDLSPLRRLFKKKIHHHLIFDLLLRCNKDEFAYSLLIDYYLGDPISLSHNAKDHVEDLALLLDSIVEKNGEEGLKNLLYNQTISKANLKNRRFQSAVEFALDLEEGERPQWLTSKLL